MVLTLRAPTNTTTQGLFWTTNSEPYINKTIASYSQVLFSLGKVRRYITSKVAIQIYKSLIMTKLNYGGVLCFGANQANLDLLQKFQNRTLLVCLCVDRYTSNIRLHIDSNFLPLFLRRKMELYKCMYSRMFRLETNNHNLTSVSSSRSVVADLPHTRFNLSRPTPIDKPNTKRFLNSVTYQGPKLGAALPP